MVEYWRDLCGVGGAQSVGVVTYVYQHHDTDSVSIMMIAYIVEYDHRYSIEYLCSDTQ